MKHDPRVTLAALAHPGLNSAPLRGSLTHVSLMSLWIRKTERTGRRALYLLDTPWELAFLLLGIAIALLVVCLRRLF
jgi:hypothetical protein